MSDAGGGGRGGGEVELGCLVEVLGEADAEEAAESLAAAGLDRVAAQGGVPREGLDVVEVDRT